MRRYFTERLIRACAELPKMCEFFHIPFQSGDNDILRQMKCARAGARCRCPLARQHAALRAARGALLCRQPASIQAIGRPVPAPAKGGVVGA